MTQLETSFGERITSNATGTSLTYVAQGSPVLAAATLVPGKKYLILARGEASMASIGATGGIKLRHGSTDFPGSEMVFTTASLQNDRVIYHYMTVWTAVASEDVVMMIRGDGTFAAQNRWCTLGAIRLSDALVEDTDWFFDEAVANTTLTTTGQVGASVTWTPGAGGNDWLVITDAALEIDNVSDQFVSRLERTGAVTASWDAIYGGRAVGDKRQLPGIFIGTLTAAEHTFREAARRIGTGSATARRTRSAVFALNLSKCDAATYVTDDTQNNPTGTTDFSTQGAQVVHDQLIGGGKVLCIGYLQFSPLTDASTAYRYYTGRMQLNGVDLLSVDGATNTYSDEAARPRFVDPAPHSVRTGQAFPYVMYSIETLTPGASNLDLDFGVSALVAKGGRYFRAAVISLDVASAPPPAGAGGTPSTERNEQLMYLHDPKAGRRRIAVRVVDATDNVTPEVGEAGGQPAMSLNGGAFTTAGVGTLVAVEASNGLYYCEITQAALSELGSLRLRYKSAATALFTTTIAVEQLPTLYDGLATGGGANYVDLSSPPTFVQDGTIARIVFGTGLGQSMLVQSFASGRCTMEDTWDTIPDATSRIVLEPGLPMVIPDANIAQVNKSAAAAAGLQEGAEAITTFVVRAGANGPTQLVTSLPTLVAGVATPPNFWANRGFIVKTGPLAGDEAAITASSVSGVDTIITVDTLTGTPAVGVKCVLT